MLTDVKGVTKVVDFFKYFFFLQIFNVIVFGECLIVFGFIHRLTKTSVLEEG